MNKEISPNQALKNVKLYFKWRVQRAKKLVTFAEFYTNINNKKIELKSNDKIKVLGSKTRYQEMTELDPYGEEEWFD